MHANAGTPDALIPGRTPSRSAARNPPSILAAAQLVAALLMSAALFWAFMQAFGLSNLWWSAFAFAFISIQWASKWQDSYSG